MPSPFKKLNRGANNFFRKVSRGTNHFFKKDIPHVANEVGGQIKLGARKTKEGLERVGKEIQKNSGYITDALAVGGILAAPFSGGASLALEGLAAGNQAVNDATKKAHKYHNLVNSRINSGQQKMNDVVSNTNRQAINGLGLVNRKANRTISKATMVAQNQLKSLANSMPVSNSMANANSLAGNDDDANMMKLH